MKRFLLCSSALLLSACSTDSQLNVVNNLTMMSENEGIALNPSRWFISHPLQTTYVSLNGQIALKAGQICIASGYRSPFTNNCREIGKNKKFYSEYYKPEGTDSSKNQLKNFLNVIYAEQQAQIDYVNQTTKYYSCITKENAKIAKQEETVDLADKDVLEKTKAQIPLACDQEKQLLDQALAALKKEQAFVQKQSSMPNRVVYNWAKSFKFEGGTVVNEASNSAASEVKNEASGYTVVNGLHIDRYQLTCDDLRHLRKRYGDANRLKIVTLTLSADELYYNAREYKAAAFNANLSFTPKELMVLKDVLGSKADVKANLALANASNLSSSGYLTTPAVEDETSKTSSQGLTYYAVLTDLKSLESSCSE